MLTSAALALAALLPAQPPTAPFTIKDGDRIVWIGSTVVEREQRYGYWETALHAAYPDKSFTLRNLGWSGDTVYGDARAGFENAAKGFKDLIKLTLDLKPTVIFVSYGTNEAFEGAEGLPKFEKGLETLLDALKPANARIVLFTPMQHEKATKLVDSTARNRQLKLYSEAISKTAKKREIYLADLYFHSELWMDPDKSIEFPSKLTDNGMHLTETGYKYLADGFLFPFIGFKSLEWNVDWKRMEKMRQAIIAKNELFFHRWRPQNETYLFGFRKHEQGNNAVEVAKFEPLVAEADKEIEKLRLELLK